jgi:glucose/arabinose dehydrogenase
MRRYVVVLVMLLLHLIPVAALATYVFNAFPDLPSFTAPIGIEDPMDGTDRLFIAQRGGFIYVIQNDPTVSTRTLFLDISAELTTSGEGGLLGLAFHPQYETNRFFYVTYTAESPRREVLARYTASASNPNVAVAGSRLIIHEVLKNQLFHNGGRIAFGPDGYLYWSLGEDGAAHLAQDITTFNGKVLRIDVNNPSGGRQYGIPPDNPFVGKTGLDEIWAFGFRNPWRFSFDPPTGRLWLADVGQDNWEEINIVRKGRNYGWPRMEGNACFSPQPCDTSGLNVVPPLFAYPHEGSASVTGGFVYRGSRIPSLVGDYIYADFITGEIWALSWNGINPPSNAFLTTLHSIPSFGIDKDGEVFMASFGGDIYELFLTATSVPTPAASTTLAVAPNPFQTHTTISFSSPPSAGVTLDVFDVAGRRVTTLDIARTGTAGEVRWDGRDETGRPLGSGVYFVRLSVDGNAVATRRVTLIK